MSQREILFKAKRIDERHKGEWIEGIPFLSPDKDRCVLIHAVAVHPDYAGDECQVYYSEGTLVDPQTVCQYTGKKILQNQVTAEKATDSVKVWQDDLIAIYTIYYDDDDNLVRNKIAVVRVEFDETYQIFYAKCVHGTMEEVVSECDIEYMDGSQDWPFTFWLEYMENSESQWWEWEIVGNIWEENEP